MVEIVINAPTGAPTTPASSLRVPESVRGHAATAHGQTSPLNTAAVPTHTSSTVAPDVLIAAQQARDTTRAQTSGPQTFDVRPAVTTGVTQQGNENKQNYSDNRPDDGGAEIIPLYGNSLPSSRDSGGISNGGNANSNASPELGPELGLTTRANQAYVHAGAADGRVFASANHAASALNAGGLNQGLSTLDLIV